MRVLVTRPEPGGSNFAGLLEAGGHQCLLAPIARIEPLSVDLPSPTDVAALVLTSANGLLAFSGHGAIPEAFLGLPLFAVGDATADAARAAGFRAVRPGPGDGARLVSVIRDELLADREASRDTEGRAGLVCHLTGDRLAVDVTAALTDAGIAARSIAVYRTRYVTTLPDAIATALDDAALDAVTHFSAEGARRLVALSVASGRAEQLASLRHYCFSPAIGEALGRALAEHVSRGRGGLWIAVSQKPNSQELLALLGGGAAR